MLRAALLASVGLLAAASGHAHTLTADFVVEQPKPCIDGACVVVVKALGEGSKLAASDPALDPRTDLVYAWDFGNPHNPLPDWKYGSRRGKTKNEHCCDHWFAHFYEGDTGTRTISLTVRDPKNGLVATATKTVEVVAQNAQWPGKATHCINPAGDADFTGCPAGAAHHQIGDPGYSDFDNAVGETGSVSNRLLFKCAGVEKAYPANSGFGPTMRGRPKLIGGYGVRGSAGAKGGVGSAGCGMTDADSYYVRYSADASILGGNSSGLLYDRFTLRDGTFRGGAVGDGASAAIDLQSGDGRGGREGGGEVLDFVAHRTRFYRFGMGAMIDMYRRQPGHHDRIWLHESDFIDNATGSGGCEPGNGPDGGGNGCNWGVQLSCYTCGVIGSHFGQIGSHDIRSSKGFYRAIAHVTVDGTETSGFKAYFKLNGAHETNHLGQVCSGDCESDACMPACQDHDYYVGWNFVDEAAITVRDAKRDHFPYGVITLTSQTGGGDSLCGNEEIKQCIVEGNYIAFAREPAHGALCIQMDAHDCVVRNNVCNMGSAAGGNHFVFSTRDPYGKCTPFQMNQRIQFLNNTVYLASSSPNENPNVRVGSGSVGVRVQNNFLFGRKLAGPDWIDPLSQAKGAVVDHNPSQSGGATPFAGPEPLDSLESFSLTGTAKALDAGAAVPAGAADAAAMCRPNPNGGFDAGAFERGAVACRARPD